MKYAFRVALFALLCLTSSALALGQKLRVEAGLNASNLRLSTPSVGYSGDVRLGYRLGLGTELRLGERLYVAPMLMVKSAGAKLNLQANLIGEAKGALSAGSLPNISELKTFFGEHTPELVEHEAFIPIFVGIQMRPVRWLGIKLEVGPYVGYTFASQLHWANLSFNLSDLPTLTKGIAERHAWDGGLTGSIALLLSRFYLKAGLEYGMMNRFVLRNLTNDQHELLSGSLASVPGLSSIMVESLTRIMANSLNFHFTLGITL
ncbi:MAG: outer membrane beta-barrel protein [Porphyromonadaceae bacterium]|nr:outer membrane beta-barrel protein [Porphyromonadaceae bacterium]